MWYKTKKEFLESIWKDGRNTKCLDKMVEKGVVIEKNGMYIMRREYEKIQEKKGNNDELEQLKKEIRWLKQELEESNTNVEYYRDKYMEMKTEYEELNERKRDGVWRWISRRLRIPSDQYDDFCEEREQF